MNEGQTQNITNNYSYEDAKKVIKMFLDKTSDCLRELEDEHGYDTNELHITFNMLRYEVLSDDNIRLMYEKNVINGVINKINSFYSVLTNLTEQLETLDSKLKSNEFKVEETEDDIYWTKDDIIEKIPGALAGVLLAATIAIQPFLIKKGFINIRKLPAYEYTVDSQGHTSSSEEEKEYTGYYRDSSVVIEKYSKVDENGHRLKLLYIPGENVISLDDDQELANLDEKDLIYVGKEKVKFNENDNKSLEEYTSVVRYNRFDIESTEHTVESVLCTILEVCLLLLHVFLMLGTLFLLEDDKLDEDEQLLIPALYVSIVQLAGYKIKLDAELVKLGALKLKSNKLEKMVNTLNKRIDKTIVDCSTQIAQHELFMEQQKLRQAYQNKEKEDELKKEKEEEEKKKVDNIASILSLLSDELSKTNSFDESQLEKLYHSISITDTGLFEQDGDHLKIRSAFIPFLKFFDLSLISFKNVDIRYIDFTNTNASIDLRKVYRMDASFAKFDDCNIHDWSDYTGVNISGAQLGENVDTMVGIDNAIMNEDTVLRQKNNTQTL